MISTVLAVVVAAGSFSSLAQPAESAAQLQRQQEERERQLREQLEAPANVRRDGNGPRKAARLPVMPEAPCFHIARIVLAGEDSARFQWALKAANRRGDRALGRCLGSEGINVVLARVQDALVARGYVTSRVLAGPQDLSTGTLVLTVVPGHVRALRFAGPPSRRASLGNAVPASPGALLNLRDIEQGLENLQRVPSATADINANPVKFAWGESFTATREQYNDFRYFGELLSNDKQSLAAIADALGAAGWTKQDFQQAYNPQLLALANQQRGEDGKAVMEMFSGDVGMGLGIIAKIINGDIKGATADAAIAAIPWGIGKILRPIIPVADAGKGLIRVGGKKLEAKWVNAQGDLTWIDPLTNKIEVFPNTAILNADHILPRDAIEKIAGFDDLPQRIQNALLEDPRNYQPMVKSANCSKGCKVEGPTGGWVMWNGRLVHPEYKVELEKQQQTFREIVDAEIRKHGSASR